MYIKDKDQCFGGKRNEPISAPRQWVGEGVNKHLTALKESPLTCGPCTGLNRRQQPKETKQTHNFFSAVFQYRVQNWLWAGKWEVPTVFLQRAGSRNL